jgi:hypothetical protein
MKKFIFLIFIAVFIACDDDSSGENVPEDGIRNYVPHNVGTYWYYETYAEDQNGNDSLVTRDSIIVEEQTQYEGREAIKCRSFSMSADESEYSDNGEFYLSSGNDQLYIYSDGFLSVFGADFPLGDPSDFLEIESQWILIGDKNQDRWDAFETEVNFNFIQFEVTGDTEAKGRKISTSQIERFDNWNYLVDEYDLNIINDLTINFIFPVPVEIELDFTIKYADQLGIYNIFTVSSEVDIPGQELPETPPTNQRLIRTNAN